MASADLLLVLLEAGIALTLALLLVLSLRLPARRWLGARAAYVLWLALPAAALAVLLPHGVEVPLAVPVAWAMPVQVGPGQPLVEQGFDWRPWLAMLWLAGAAAMLCLLAAQQRAFSRALGVLHRRDDGLYQSRRATAGLPAVSGLVRPRILLPADFEQRYTPREQHLVLEHERLHLRRGDLVANAVMAALRCLFWFHPLLPPAQRRFRHDQELACDAAVVARHPQGRRAYGEAMLKTQFDATPLPLGCHWQVHHPLKERIDMLRYPVPGAMRRVATTLCALAVTACVAFAAWAAQPGQAPPAAASAGDSSYVIARQSQYGTQAGDGVLMQVVTAGEPAVSVIGQGADRWRSSVTASAGPEPGTTYLRFELGRGEPLVKVAQPAVLVRNGEAGMIEERDDDGRLAYRTSFRVLPVQGGVEATMARMRALMASPAGVAMREAPAADHDAFAVERMPPPRYPADAARDGVEGEVLLLITVAADGSVRNVQVESATPEGVFEAGTLEAARQWRFQPAMRGGEPVEGQVRVPVTFRKDPPEAGATKG